MIDTVVLTLNHEEFSIQEPERFNPSARILFSTPPRELGSRGNMSCYQNPTKTELKEGNYKPRLTLNKRIRAGGYAITLKIEFSAPKLLLGNNFDELEEIDFDHLLNKLFMKITDMGIVTTLETLREAQVSAIHYSKNVILEDFLTSSMMIRELGKIDLHQHLDLANTDYRNNGHALRYHTNSYEIVFYDKIKDMEQSKKSEKRSMEMDNLIQLDLFKNKLRTIEVLRMEIRLGNKTKIKSLLKGLKIETPVTFCGLFKKHISKRILLYFWEKISESFSLLSMSSLKPEDLYLSIQAAGKGKRTIAKNLQLLGAKILIDSVGIRGLRSLFDYASNRTWQRIKKEVKGCFVSDNSKIDMIYKLSKSLNDFNLLKPSSYQKDVMND